MTKQALNQVWLVNNAHIVIAQNEKQMKKLFVEYTGGDPFRGNHAKLLELNGSISLCYVDSETNFDIDLIALAKYKPQVIPEMS